MRIDENEDFSDGAEGTQIGMKCSVVHNLLFEGKLTKVLKSNRNLFAVPRNKVMVAPTAVGDCGNKEFQTMVVDNRTGLHEFTRDIQHRMFNVHDFSVVIVLLGRYDLLCDR